MKTIFKLIVIAQLIITVAGSCQKSAKTTLLSDGKYTGTFQRQINGSGQISQVTITLSNGNWIGETETPRYPALCNGTFKIEKGNKINFTNNCVWTADFDWTLILSQEYDLSVNGNTYIFTKNTGNGNKDIYTLQKQ